VLSLALAAVLACSYSKYTAPCCAVLLNPLIAKCDAVVSQGNHRYINILICLDAANTTTACSNYPEKLDAALIRPGRIDKKQYLSNMQGPEAR
jgi:hypothetical protein